MEENTTDKAIFSMPLSKLVPMIIAIVLFTNTVSLTVQRVSNLEEKEAYNNGATKRKIAHSEDRSKLERKIEHQEIRYDILKKELEYCKKK
jgi:phage-related minor tail protein